jgi:hypothetical protein
MPPWQRKELHKVASLGWPYRDVCTYRCRFWPIRCRPACRRLDSAISPDLHGVGGSAGGQVRTKDHNRTAACEVSRSGGEFNEEVICYRMRGLLIVRSRPGAPRCKRRQRPVRPPVRPLRRHRCPGRLPPCRPAPCSNRAARFRPGPGPRLSRLSRPVRPLCWARHRAGTRRVPRLPAPLTVA